MGDAEAIRGVLTAAFPSGAEADLVEQLRADGDLSLEFVATIERAVVGHLGFSRMTVEADGERLSALALAPVAVRPNLQRRGIGRRLIECGLAGVNSRGTAILFVLGEPALYGRFGFRIEAAAPFASPYAGPHFMAQWLSSPRRPASGRADHALAFAALE